MGSQTSLARARPAWDDVRVDILGVLLVLILRGRYDPCVTYFAAEPRQRQRFQWVIAGVVLVYEVSQLRLVLGTLLGVHVFTRQLLMLRFGPRRFFYACAPFAIAYAVVRQRVFEISFVVSRTLVYTIVSATSSGSSH